MHTAAVASHARAWRCVLAAVAIAAVVPTSCDNPTIGQWTPQLPPTVRVANPTDTATPVYKVTVPEGATALRYRLVQEAVADGTETVLVDDAQISIAAVETVADEAGWDRISARWVRIEGERPLSFSYEESFDEAAFLYTLSVAATYDDAESVPARRGTVVDLTAPAAPTIDAASPVDGSITVVSESVTLSWAGPDDTLSHYIVTWGSGDEELVAIDASGAAPAGRYSVAGPLVHGDNFELTIWAVDTAGNRSTAAVSEVTVDLNSMIPTFPTSDNRSQTADPQLVWTWVAPAGSSKVRYSIESVSGSSTSQPPGRTEIDVDTTSPTGQVTHTAPGEGTYTLSMQAWFPTTATWSVENSHAIVLATCDLPAPTVTGEERTNLLQPVFTWLTLDGAAAYRYQIDGQVDGNWIEVATAAGAEQDLTLSSPLARGSHTIYLQAQDVGGIWSASGSFTFTIETELPRLLSIGLYEWDASANAGAGAYGALSSSDLGRVPPDAHIRVFFSEEMAIDAGSDVVRCNPDVALDAPVDISGGNRTDFEIHPTGGWPEGDSLRCWINLALADLAENEVDPTTYREESFTAAVYFSTAAAAVNVTDAALQGVLSAFDGNPYTYTHEVSSLDLSPEGYDGIRETIVSLAGLDAFEELRYLDLSGCTEIADASPLAGLTELGYVDVSNTAVTDLSFLSGANRLLALRAAKSETALGASYGRITDLSALSGISGLRLIDLRGNDLQAGAAGGDSAVTAPLAAQSALETLLLSDNMTFADASFLTSSLPSLTSLWINNCGLPTLDLSNQSRIEQLRLDDNPSLATITGLPTGLTSLNLSGTGITDLSSVTALTSLTELRVSNNPSLSDISAVAGNTTIEVLSLAGCNIDSSAVADPMATIGSMTGLTDLDLSDNAVADVTDFAALTALQYLDLSGNSVTGIGPVLGLAALATLDLADNAISILPTIGWLGLSSMAYLDLSGNQIADVGPLGDLPSVGTLLLARNVDGGGSTTITGGIAALSNLFSVPDGPSYPPNPLYYLVFSGNDGMSTGDLADIESLIDNKPSWTTIVRPSEANPFEATP